MDGRRLVDAPGDRLEVTDVERERPEVAVPADEVEWVMLVVQAVTRPRVLTSMTKSPASVWGSIGWRAEVTLAVRGVLEELPEVVAVALGRDDGRWRLDPQHPLGLARGRDDAVGGADGDDQVVAGP